MKKKESIKSKLTELMILPVVTRLEWCKKNNSLKMYGLKNKNLYLKYCYFGWLSIRIRQVELKF